MYMEESLKSAHKRLDEIGELTQSVYELAASIKVMQGNITDISGRIKTIEDKPAKRWELIISTIITTVAGVVSGALVGGVIR